MSTTIIIITFSYTFLFTALAQPGPNPVTLQPNSPPSTIPAFPEQSDVSGCPLHLPDDFFHGIKSACGSKPHKIPDPSSYSGQLHRTRCCPVLAAYLYSAYAKTALSTNVKLNKPQQQYDMPVLPDDSESCVDSLEKELENRGIELGKVNETCDVVYCYCGIRLRSFGCPEAFSVDSRGNVVGGGVKVKRLEEDCYGGGGAIGGCSDCLNALYLLDDDKAGRNNTSERTSKTHNRDCELMGLTWLLNKDRSAYIRTVSAVLRALMIYEDEGEVSDPTYCSLNSDVMPLAVDSSQINSQPSSTVMAIKFYQRLLPISLLCMTAFLVFTIFN